MSSAITYVILSLGWSLCAFGGWTNSYYHVTDQKPHLSVSFGLIVRHLGVEFDHTWLSMFPLWSFPVSFPAGGTLDLLSYVGQVQQRGRSSVFGPDGRGVCASGQLQPPEQKVCQPPSLVCLERDSIVYNIVLLVYSHIISQVKRLCT